MTTSITCILDAQLIKGFMAIHNDDMAALYKRMLYDDVGFNEMTEGPRHRNLLIGVLTSKHSSSLIRERLVAEFLGLQHITKMHSTTDDFSTYDAVEVFTGKPFEIKAEQHVRVNLDRKTNGGQISGTGLFSSISGAESIDKLLDDNPRIAHGMFLDDRLLCIVSFDFALSDAPKRIMKYFHGGKKTVPRYMYCDWINTISLVVEYISPYWPRDLYTKYKRDLTRKYNTQPNNCKMQDKINTILSNDCISEIVT